MAYNATLLKNENYCIEILVDTEMFWCFIVTVFVARRDFDKFFQDVYKEETVSADFYICFFAVPFRTLLWHS